MPNNNKPDRQADVGDIVLGLVSLVDQFGSILSQRGRDFRQTERGRQVDRSISAVLGELSRTQKDGVTLLTSVVDRLLSAVNRHNGANGSGGGSGRPPRANGRARKKKGRPPVAPRKSNLSVRI